MKDPNLYFTITRKCNLRCKHCYLKAGPEHSDTTISKEDFRSIIDNLPEVSLTLILSGGEIFTIQDILFDYLGYIKEKNIQRSAKNQQRIHITLQTNGFWAVNDDKIKITLFDLLSLGVEALDISSDDKYHYEQGINKKNLDKLYGLIKDSKIFNVELRGILGSRGIMPIGRAKEMQLGKPSLNYRGINCKNSLTDYQLTIREDGTVYTCCYNFFQLPGNLIKKPLEDIVRDAHKSERLSIINSKGIKGLAIRDGWKKRDVEDLIDTYGRCGFCYQYYKPKHL